MTASSSSILTSADASDSSVAAADTASSETVNVSSCSSRPSLSTSTGTVLDVSPGANTSVWSIAVKSAGLRAVPSAVKTRAVTRCGVTSDNDTSTSKENMSSSKNNTPSSVMPSPGNDSDTSGTGIGTAVRAGSPGSARTMYSP